MNPLKKIAATVAAATLVVAGFTQAPLAAAQSSDVNDPAAITSGLSFPEITPGMTVVTQSEPNRLYYCTLSMLAQKESTGELYGITAGHCFMPFPEKVGEPSITPSKVGDPVYAQTKTGEFKKFGTLVSAISNPHVIGRAKFPEKVIDVGIIKIDPGLRYDPKIAGYYEVEPNWFPTDDLASGQEVCHFGIRTLEQCGTVDGSFSSRIGNILVIPGDSGSPIYLKTGGNKVAVTGVLSRGDAAKRSASMSPIAALMEQEGLVPAR